MAAKRRATTRARAAVVPLPRAARRRPFARFGRLAPSPRSVAGGGVLVLAAAIAYLVALQTPLFAVRRVEVVGASPAVAAEVRAALTPLRGRSLVALHGGDVERRIESLPAVLAVGYDRAFPHTLRIIVRPERPVAVLRRAQDSWLVSRRGRVLERLRPRALPQLPRIWIPRATRVDVGAVPSGPVAGAAAALAQLARRGFPLPVRSATVRAEDVALGLGGGIELRLGDTGDTRLKLEVARRVVRALPAGTTYVDVSVPARPVAGSNPQVSTTASPLNG